MYFRNYGLRKAWLDKCLKSPVSGTFRESTSLSLLNTVEIYLTPLLSYFSITWKRLSSKISLLVICEIVGLFVNTLTANDKYSLHNRKNLPQPIQMQLSKKQKKFSQFCFAFLKFRSSFKIFEKIDDLHSLCISEITVCEKYGYIYV